MERSLVSVSLLVLVSDDRDLTGRSEHTCEGDKVFTSLTEKFSPSPSEILYALFVSVLVLDAQDVK